MREEHMLLEVDSVVKVWIDLIKIMQLKNVYNVVNMVTKMTKKKKRKMYSTKMEKEKPLQQQHPDPLNQNPTELKTKPSPMPSPKSIKDSIVKANFESVLPSILNFLIPARMYNDWKSMIFLKKLDGQLQIVPISLKFSNKRA